jgi:L-ascorbate metabolism protein UlaG (beta-lactamase superfamily)
MPGSTLTLVVVAALTVAVSVAPAVAQVAQGIHGAQTAQVVQVAQTAPASPRPEIAESCPGLVARTGPRIIPAVLRSLSSPDPPFLYAALAVGEVRVDYIGHSTFLIESPRGVRIATDYNDYVRPRIVPDVVTMNHAHSTHYTDRPDPAIKHVLRGWSSEFGKPARIDVQIDDVHIRNVPTNIRSWSYGEGATGIATERHGNSIFVFEVGSLCIAHLGHLHHTLTPQQFSEIGRVDVVLVPVDGSYTLDLDGMVEVLQGLKAPMMIPMHYFSGYTLNNFLQRLERLDWDIERSASPSVVLSRAGLPAKPKVLVLPGR